MVKLVFCCTRRPDLSREDFLRYWLDHHGPLVRSVRAAMPGMVRYVQSHTIDTPLNDALRASRGSAQPYDGITEVWFESLESLGMATDEALTAGQRLLEDEARFLDLARCALFLTTEHEIF